MKVPMPVMATMVPALTTILHSLEVKPGACFASVAWFPDTVDSLPLPPPAVTCGCVRVYV